MSPTGRAIAYLRDQVAPRAAEIDANTAAVASALHGLQALDLMALRRPAAYGGPEVSESDFREFQEEAARASGTFAFLQTQHQSAVGMIARSENESLKERYLPLMGNGGKTVGIGFSQLRRPGPPIMRATEDGNGYRLNGHVPWITGFGFFKEFLIGAQLEDGRAVFAVIPLEPELGLAFSEPMPLAAMMAANTVSLEITDFFVAPDQVAFIQSAGWIQRNDEINVALQGHFAVGCARAALDVLQAAADRKKLPGVCRALDRLTERLEQSRIGLLNAEGDRLAARADAIDTMLKCAQAAVVASSGAANSLAHPAQRIYREALVFSVSAQTSAIMEATLDTI